MLAHQPIEWSCPIVVAFHGNGHRQRVARFNGSNAMKKLAETCNMMIDIEFIYECVIGQSNRHSVPHATNINTNTKGVRFHR